MKTPEPLNKRPKPKPKPKPVIKLTWDDYVKARPGLDPILMPVLIGMDKNGGFTKRRYRAGEVKKTYLRSKGDFPPFMSKWPKICPDPHGLFKDYIAFFEASDFVQSPKPPNPWDLQCDKPVWILFVLEPKTWTFSKDRQYSTKNDPDDMTRNFEKVCVMDGGKALLLSNRCRSNPKGLEYNLHVDISQIAANGETQVMPVIFDPGNNNKPKPPF